MQAGLHYQQQQQNALAQAELALQQQPHQRAGIVGVHELNVSVSVGGWLIWACDLSTSVGAGASRGSFRFVFTVDRAVISSIDRAIISCSPINNCFMTLSAFIL